MKPIKPVKIIKNKNSIIQKLKLKKTRIKQIENTIYEVYNKWEKSFIKELKKELKELGFGVDIYLNSYNKYNINNYYIYYIYSIKNKTNHIASFKFVKQFKDDDNNSFYEKFEYGIKISIEGDEDDQFISRRFITLATTDAVPCSFNTDLVLEQFIEYLDVHLNLINIGEN